MTHFIGLTGSIGMGKSTTAQMFRDEGIKVHDADATVHDLYSGEAAPLVEAAFPGTVQNGTVDRAILGQRVLGDSEAIQKLEAIIHPLVRDAELAFRSEIENRGDPVAVLDIPLLFETKSTNRVDSILVVTAPAEVQRERVMAREGMSEDRFHAILARQVPDTEKRAKADFVIDTSKGLDYAREQVQTVLASLLSTAQS